MSENNIPPLKFSEVAQFDRDAIVPVADLLILTFPAHESDLPEPTRLLVSSRRPVHDGDAVAAAARNGRTMTGFYRRNGSEARIVSLNRQVRLQWHIGEEKQLFNWIFPVLAVDISCCAGKKSPRSDSPGAGESNLLDRSFQIRNQINGFVEVVE